MNFKRLKTIITLATIGLFLSTNTAYAQHGQYVGGDISDLPLYEKSNTYTPYLDANGNKIEDLLIWLKQTCGWNTFRVRLFVSPDGTAKDASGNVYTDPSVAQDLTMVEKLGKRIKDAGAKFMLDFHYSDCWADPVKQYAPASWSYCTTSATKAQKIYDYTVETLKALKDYGAEPDLVQVGNEITGGIVGVWKSSDAAGFKSIVEKGCDAVRAECPNAQIIIHIESPQNTENVIRFYNDLDQSKYDIIGLSYYPFWHGYLNAEQTKEQNPTWMSWAGSDLAATLIQLKTSFPQKKVQIVETAYYNNYWPTSGVKYDTHQSLWPASVDGQYKYICDLITELAKHDNVNGLLYWFPEEAGNGDTSASPVLTGWINRGLWDPNTSQSGSTWGHKPLNSAKVQYKLKDFLDPTITSISNVNANVNVNKTKVYTISGQYVGDDISKISIPGLYISGGKKISIH